MNYAEKQLDRYRTRTQRFLDIMQASAPARILAEEGALILESMIAIAGPEVLSCYARVALKHSKEVNGICPWDHDDDPAMHPVVKLGMCAEHLAERDAAESLA